jgi:predicted component of type VI protein secretion system
MKVELIVVRGRPEGKVIPLSGTQFKIGRGETCHLRPNSEQVSREHAEFSVTADGVSVRDLGSRNGTLVNGKAVTTIAAPLKDRDLVQVGPLTFAVSIQDAPVAAMAAAPLPAGKAAPEDVDNEDIESWLVADAQKSAAPERPSAVYSGDTITVAAFRDNGEAMDNGAVKPADTSPATEEDTDEAYERLSEVDGLVSPDSDTDEMDTEAGDVDDDAGDEEPVEFVDETNPFYAAKKKAEEGPSKQVYADTSDAARDILRKLMERRRQARSSG